ncbi:MAG: DUF362 domain-containing protein [Oscillospiraceae bacterium]|jgi:uncharacterized Fe-S center protein|nr:DUF362 domain-containing protein [Oscillospiraceae bacterium]
MPAKLLFAPVAYARYEKEQTLPCKFERMLERSGLGERLKDKTVAIKMHVGDGVSYSTIPPVFVRSLVDYVKKNGGDCYITDHYVQDRHPERRGYTDSNLGCPVLEACAHTGKYVYSVDADFKTLRHIDIAGLIRDADFLIDFSHVKGHGCCAYGGACKNIAMGCVTDRTRHELHALEGGLAWDESKCVHCDQCLSACNHDANEFGEDGRYEINFHHCTLCQHCAKVCPTGAITLDNHGYADFQQGMAVATRTILDKFLPDNVYYINVLLQITALCDCWGLTTPGLVPDIGILAGGDMVAIEKASLDMIRMEDLVKVGVPQGYELSGSGHLFEQLHGKNPFTQLEALESVGLGKQDYELVTVN